MTISLSVVSITYKDPVGLRDTLQSLELLLDRGLTWEHVVVDSSPDESSSVLSSLSLRPKWPLVRVEVPPQGIYAAFNSGLAAAKGNYVWFLNSGDCLKSVDALRAALEAFEGDNSLDLALSSADLTRHGKYLYTKRPAPTLLGNVLGSNRLCHQALLYRRAALNRVGPFATDLKLAGDYEYHFRCYVAGLKAKRIDATLVEYDMGGSSSDYRKAFSEFKSVHRRLRGALPAWVSTGNQVLWAIHFAWVSALKFFASSALAPALKPLWLGWNRLKR